MPTYSYACTACGHRFDAQQSFDDASLTECPQCAGALRKLFGAVGVVFKGSGFYRTDSRSSSRGAATPSRPKADAPASASTSTGGDTSKAAAASA